MLLPVVISTFQREPASKSSLEHAVYQLLEVDPASIQPRGNGAKKGVQKRKKTMSRRANEARVALAAASLDASVDCPICEVS